MRLAAARTVEFAGKRPPARPSRRLRTRITS